MVALFTADAALRFASAAMELKAARLKAASPEDAAAMVAREERWFAAADKILSKAMPDLFALAEQAPS